MSKEITLELVVSKVRFERGELEREWIVDVASANMDSTQLSTPLSAAEEAHRLTLLVLSLDS